MNIIAYFLKQVHTFAFKSGLLSICAAGRARQAAAGAAPLPWSEAAISYKKPRSARPAADAERTHCGNQLSAKRKLLHLGLNLTECGDIVNERLLSCYNAPADSDSRSQPQSLGGVLRKHPKMPVLPFRSNTHKLKFQPHPRCRRRQTYAEQTIH